MKTNFSSEQEFIKTIAPSAQKACKRYGYLPSVLIAQACLENGYGIPSYWDNQEIKSLLQYNNMIGQKAELLTSSWYDKSVWPGKSFSKNTPEVYSGKQVIIKDSFRIFDDIQQSFCDFILFLLYASNYGYNGKPKYGAEVVNIKEPEKLIKEVGSRGYATGPTYPSSVMKIVNKHNLTQYDDLSKIKASKYIPDALKNNKTSKITKKTIHDITSANLSQVPASRGNNPIEWIVIHYLGVPNADNPYLYGGGLGGHYNVQRNGEIYKAADPKTAVVWHCGGDLQGPNGHQYYKICTNYNSIGIETGVCYTDTSEKYPDANSNKWYYTTETQQSLVYLVAKLMKDYNIDINHVIRHYDVTGKICPNPYVKNNKLKTSWTWDEFKNKLITYCKSENYNTILLQESATQPSKNNIQSSYLSIGSVGESVKEMQVMLIKLGYSCGSSGADGDFGNNTKIALEKFQKENNLIIDGLYGTESKQKLESLYKDILAKENPTNTDMKIDYAKSYNKDIAKTYKTTTKLRLRTGASTSKTIITIIPKGDKVVCYGYHTGNWYYVQYGNLTGFCLSKYLK